MTTVNKDHGRIEQREIRVSECLNQYLDFPYVGQVFRIQRHTYHVKSGRETHETVHGITSLLPNLATPQRLLGLNRNHWGIENKLHRVRDVTFDEDRSQIRTGQAPRVMASLHNLVINVFRICGSKNIAKTFRSFAFNTRRALKLIGLSTAQHTHCRKARAANPISRYSYASISQRPPFSIPYTPSDPPPVRSRPPSRCTFFYDAAP